MSEQPESSSRPVTVAELLARNGQSDGASSRRHRRRTREGGVSVAELTGEIPVIREPVIDDDRETVPRDEEDSAEPATPEPDSAESATSEPDSAEHESAEQSYAGLSTGADAGAVEDVSADESDRYGHESAHAYENVGTATAATATAATDDSAATTDSGALETAEPGQTDGSFDFDSSFAGSAQAFGSADSEAASTTATDDEAPAATTEITADGATTEEAPAPAAVAAEPEAGGTSLPVAGTSATATAETATAETATAETATAETDAAPRAGADERSTEPDHADQDHADQDGEPKKSSSGGALRQWAGLALQVVIGIAVGAAVFKGFEKLWDSLPYVALILSVLVILGLVAVVRILRKTDDIISLLLAVVVGVVVTLGPLAFVLSTQ